MFQPCLHYECQNRNNAGYCKSTVCINPKYNGSTNTVVGYIETKPKTNADRIRAMSDEELVEYLYGICDCAYANVPCKEHCGEMPCRDAWMKWLKQEAET